MKDELKNIESNQREIIGLVQKLGTAMFLFFMAITFIMISIASVILEQLKQ